MVKRQCFKCKATFNQKGHYEYHINRKTDCVPIGEYKNNENKGNQNDIVLCGFVQSLSRNMRSSCGNMQEVKSITNYDLTNQINIDNIDNMDDLLINPDDIIFACSYCHKNYSSKSTLTRHLKDNCRAKKENDKEKENIFKLLLEKDKQKDVEINELKKQNKLLMDKIDKLIQIKDNPKISNTINNNQKITNSTRNDNSVNTQNNNQKITNNTQNNIVMVNFGKEDLSIIDERQFIEKIVKKPTITGVKIPDEVLKIIHFNPQYPQLSNIYISDINREKCMVYEDGEWKLSNIDNIPQIMDKICIFSKDQIDILREKYPNNKAVNDRLDIVEKYNNYIDDDYVQDLKEDDDYNNNKLLIKRAEDFQKYAYNTIKKTLYNEGKKLKKTNRLK